MDGFPFTFPYRVRIADVNYGGHVSNAAVLEFFQEARIAFLASLGPYSEIDIGQGLGMILPEARVQYRAEMFHSDELCIGVRVEQVKGSSFTLGYRVERDGDVTAEGETALVCFDYQARKPRRLPKPFQDALVSTS